MHSLTKKRALVVAAVVAAGAIAAAIATQVGTVRLGIAASVCLLLPGLGWAWKLHIGDIGDRLALALVLSICAWAVVATIMVVLGVRPMWGLVGLAAIGVVGLLPQRLLAPISIRFSTLRRSMSRKSKDRKPALS